MQVISKISSSRRTKTAYTRFMHLSYCREIIETSIYHPELLGDKTNAELDVEGVIFDLKNILLFFTLLD